MPNYTVVLEILQKVFHLLKDGKSAAFCWIHGHTGLLKSKATKAATKQAALFSNLTPEKALNGDVCTFFLHATMSWQDERTKTVGNKL
jgi:hypothetical protein